MSNIPKSKRKPTQFQLFIDLSNIRHQLTEYICHDFSNENITYLRGTNNCNPQQWRYEHERILLIDTIDRLQRYITESNSIYPITLKEYFERRRLATCAISTVEYLIQELQYISHDFSIRADKYVNMIQTLISFEQKLKAWRASTKRFKKLINDSLAQIIASEIKNVDNNTQGSTLNSASASNACNVNNNGNANNNNASNALRVCPIIEYLLQVVS